MKVNITNNLSKATLSKIAITVNNPGRYKEFNKKVTWWEYDEEKGQIVTGSKTSESLLVPITVTGTFETGTYYIPVLGDGSNVYQISIHFYDQDNNVKTLTQKYSVKPAAGKIIQFGDFSVVDSWFPVPEEPGQPEVGVLYETDFYSNNATNGVSFKASSVSTSICGIDWSLTYACYTTYASTTSTRQPHILASNRKNTSSSIIESGNLISEEKTVTSFTIALGRKHDVGICQIEYYNGSEWVVADAALATKVNSTYTQEYTYAITSVKTSDFRVRVTWKFDTAPGSYSFLMCDGIKVFGY